MHINGAGTFITASQRHRVNLNVAHCNAKQAASRQQCLKPTTPECYDAVTH
jgi:hypothetical protein